MEDALNLYTYTGQIAFPEGAPNIMDIAVSLSRECRYAGNGVHWWPVALHTFVVCDLIQDNKLKLHALLHDAAECITGDIPKPAKTAELEMIEAKIQSAIYRSMGFTLPTEEQAKVVKLADTQTLHGEVWTVGTRALRDIYPRHPRAEELVLWYKGMFPVEDCVNPRGVCVQEFLFRYKRYAEFGGYNADAVSKMLRV
jgi:hypothetical protein